MVSGKNGIGNTMDLSEIINKMITKLENREKNNSYQNIRNNNKQIFKKAIKKYQQSEKGKKTIGLLSFRKI